MDRDSEIVAHVFDERNAAVKKMIAQVIAAAKREGTKDRHLRPGAERLSRVRRVSRREGIDSISLNPDAVLKTTVKILAMEEHAAEPRASAA